MLGTRSDKKDEGCVIVYKKTVCKNCEWRGPVNELLQAKSPFSFDEDLYGCPSCRKNHEAHVCMR